MPTVTICGQTLEYEVHGAGAPVLCIDNIAVPLATTRARRQRLVEAGYQAVIFQNQGPDSASIPAFVESAAGLIDHLALGPARIWGYSQGSPVAQELALARPDLVRAVVMEATWGRQPLLGALLQQALLDHVTGCALLSPAAQAALGIMIAQPPALLADSERMRRLIDAMLHAPAPDAAARRQAERSYTATLSYDDRLEALRWIRVPSLVIAFERDIGLPPAFCRAVADAIPGCGYVEIAGAAHGGDASHADEVYTAVLAFFAEH